MLVPQWDGLKKKMFPKNDDLQKPFPKKRCFLKKGGASHLKQKKQAQELSSITEVRNLRFGNSSKF